MPIGDTDTILVDCDVHNALPSPAAIKPYLPEQWRRYYERYGLRTRDNMAYWASRPRALAARADAHPPAGGPPGSDLAFMQEQLLDHWGVDYAILGPINQLTFGGQPGKYGAALTTALNDWVASEWLDRDPRLRSGICVPFEEPDLAAQEIRSRAADRRFVQVLFNMATRDPLGKRKYWPVYEAACEQNLPIAIHVAGVLSNTLTGAGWPSYYLEYHFSHMQAAQSQLLSLVAEGVFEAFPDLQIVLMEGGFAWVAPMRWSLDRYWEKWGDEVGHLQRRPSEYIASNFWFTTQPMEEPEQPQYFKQMMTQFGLGQRLLFASDYPHWDFDAPDQAIPRSVPRDLRNNIFGEHAVRLLGLKTEAAGLGAAT